MAYIFHVCILLLLFTLSPPEASAAKILGLFPHIGKSHFFVFESLMKELASRGHHVHVLSHFPQKPPIPNYTDISLVGAKMFFGPTDGLTFEMAEESGLSNAFFALAAWGAFTCETVYLLPRVQDLIHSNDTYDLVISELFNTNCFLGFVHKFKAPHIALSSCTPMPWANDRFGNPDHPAYIPNNLLREPNLQIFYNRFSNAVSLMLMKLLTPFTYERWDQQIAEKHFGNTLPNLNTIAMNTSLMLVNTHPTLNGPRPMVPSIVEVGGLYLKQPKPLPEELNRWLNESKQGVIYFSMGSMLRAESIPAEKLAAFVQAFAELPQRVLWKWEADSLPDQPDNVRIAKWFPQWDILHHPNVRVFMAHGGLLGVIESAASGVPMVMTPMYGDQFVNSQAIKERGAAVILPYTDISKETVLKALKTVMQDSSYQENAKRLAKEYLDRPQSPMDTAIFWTEYVIRHKGAPHLRSAAVEMPWYQYLLLDVAIVLIIAVMILVIGCYLVIKKIMLLLFCNRENTIKSKQN